MPRAQGEGETGNRSRGWPGPCAGAACVSFARRYFAIEHMEKVRPGTGREAGLGHVRREVSQFCTAYQIGTL